MDVKSLTVRGCLSWDTSQDGLDLRAGYILVDGSGVFEVGTPSQPMNHRATIYLKEGEHHPDWGTRFLWAQGNSQIKIHGRVLNRTWTLLAQTAAVGSNTLELEHDVEALGWRAGDTIGIATTNRGRTRPYKITSLKQRVVEVDSPLENEHLGGLRHIELTGATGHTFEGHIGLAAEVVNLQRSVVITGKPNWDTESREGLHTGIHSTGFMDIRYARIENCGQPPHMGKYCLHFHLMHQCPKCVFQGNAVVNGTQNGITIHGTHGSLTDQNVLWNTASVGIYIEDGNEMNNTVSENVIICMHPVPRDAINPKAPENCQYDLHNEDGRLGGIFAIGMTNNIIGNRVVNMENGMWFKGSADIHGRGAAKERICPKYAPFGKIRGNVCHDNRRFGMYIDFQQPRNLKRDDNGMLPRLADGSTDWSSCNELTADGLDNGVQPANVIEDQLDYHNLFVGQYISADVEYRRYIGVNNAHCMYWKSSKNFADKRAYHMRDSMCITDWSDPVFRTRPEVGPAGHIFGPAGAFTFRLKNVTFAGDAGGMGALVAGQHCMLGSAGGPCNVQYLVEECSFLALRAGSRYLNFGANSEPPGEVLPVFLARDGSLGGYRSIVSRHLNGFEPEGCVPLGHEFDYGFGCPFPVRRLNIWSKKDLGQVQLRGPGYEVSANPDSPTLSQNAGVLQYAQGYNGYGALAIVGRSYTLEARFVHGINADFSDPIVPGVFGKLEESIMLKTELGECTLSAQGAHGVHYTRLGPEDAAPQGDCRTALGGDMVVQAVAASGCRTAVQSDECYRHVIWAMQTGIKSQPATYKGLTADSSFEDFQAFLHTSGHGNCPMPCSVCHTAIPGDECYGHVDWALNKGILLHPHVYNGLTVASSFEDFQAVLHEKGLGNCPVPCPAEVCHTAVPEDECYGHVVWAKEQGIKVYPGSYDGLTADSTFEDFQAFLFNVGKGGCPEPCPPLVMTAVHRSSNLEGRSTSCHTAVVGEACFTYVASMAVASIRHDPGHYVGAAASTLFADVQEQLHRQGLADCPLPCKAPAPEVLSRQNVSQLFRQGLLLGATWPKLLVCIFGLCIGTLVLAPLALTVRRCQYERHGWARIVQTPRSEA